MRGGSGGDARAPGWSGIWSGQERHNWTLHQTIDSSYRGPMTHQHALQIASAPSTAGVHRSSSNAFDRDQLSDLGRLLAELGPAAFEPQLAELGRMARRRGVAAHAVAAMCDRASPAIVRQRAFGVVSAAIVALQEAAKKGGATTIAVVK